MSHVLIVEDHVPIARLLRTWIESENATVMTATGAEQALLMAVEHAPAVALCDIRLPGGRDGFWFVEQLRVFRPEAAVVMTSGLPQFANAVDASREGIADFVPKPFTRERIVEALRRAMVEHRARCERAPADRRPAIETSTVLRTVLEAQSGSGARHAARVSRIAAALAAALGRPAREIADIECAVMLCDVERLDIHAIAVTVLHLGAAIAIATAAQERWDGGGFPVGLKGDAIPLGARIVAVAAAYDELVEGVGVNQLSPRQAIDVLSGQRAAEFDPAVLAALHAVEHELQTA